MEKGKKFLSDLKLYSDYLKWLPDQERYETWEEACESIIDGHRQKYNHLNLENYLKIALEQMKIKSVLASQRNLQYRYLQLIRNNERLYNCFHKDTEFISSEGVKKFSDFKNGDYVNVLTHLGNYKKAKVKSYGNQKLNKVTFKKGQNLFDVLVTSNHRWILLDGKETTNLSIGDRIQRHPTLFKDFKYDEANPLERVYWCYGMVYGDGTKVKYNGEHKYSMIRLCGNDKQFSGRFEECGFKTSTNTSLNGDFIAYTGSYLKTAPDPERDSIELIRAFVAGYLQADGTKNTNIYNEDRKYYDYIQSSEEDHINFIRECFPIVGVYIISETDLTGQETNYGIRPYTIKFRIAQEIARNMVFRVENIEENVLEDVVWCLEVEDDHSFVLPNGLVTGNCVGSLLDKNDLFQKYFHILLSGCGLDVSLRKIFISQLSQVQKRTLSTRVFVIEDSIEGWADALGVLLSSFFVENQPFPEYAGHKVLFDYSFIRPKGSFISGGFKAPGSEGLKQSLEKIEKLLNDYTISGMPMPMKSIIAYDIIMYSADAVLSGGVRRSACSVLIDEDDTEMTNAKLGNWRQNNPQRARSNNAIGFIRNSFSKEKLEEIIKLNQGDNDISFIFVHDEYEVSNPCREITFRPVLENGETGIQMCNLSEINASACNSKTTFLRACTAAAILGTLQAGYTQFPYLGETTEALVRREALIGVSVTGWMNQPFLFNAELLQEGAALIKKVNEELSAILGINPAARTTTVDFLRSQN